MQTAETILDIIHNRGKGGKPLYRLYRQLFNPGLYLKAYSEIYANKGGLTPGVSEDTIDGMSMKRIYDIIQRIRREKYRWKPTRRTHIPKKDGRTRPLGIPSGDDKLLQAVIKSLLEAYYEPQFSDRSHGFRPSRGCHTALLQVDTKHKGINWFIEADIKGCFDNINHEILLEKMEDKIKDGRFTRLLMFLMKAGYLEDWKWHRTYSGTPQGGIISPLLSNIYLHTLDEWVENELLPKYNRRPEGGRKRNPEYRRYEALRGNAKKKGDWESFKHYGKLMKTVPTFVEQDEYRKLEYVRYADDFLLSFAGPKKEAVNIKEEIRDFLNDRLKLELSMEKTLITHARTQKALFLGHEIKVRQTEQKKRNKRFNLVWGSKKSQNGCHKEIPEGKQDKRKT
jgi:group II intron reverse transcriptase/maturase